jgi:hypothetical protein
MTETAAVRVELRQTTLTESARLRETGDRPFLCIENPPPVRSLLRLTVAGELRAFEVGQVIEVVSDEQSERGCFGALVDLARLDELAKVGSEHLQPGISGGVPAPVVIMNTNEMMLGEVGSEADEAAAAGAMALPRDDGPSDEPSDDSPSDEPAGEREHVASESGDTETSRDGSE